ncbi:MAG: HEAT repeat domain-containing protein [Vicinamibacterales bacterium]
MRYPSRGTCAAIVVCAALLCGRSSEAQSISFEQTVADLSNSDVDARLRAAQDLKEAAYPEAAVPLARAVLDADDRVQYEAITGELNICLADKIVPRKRVAFVVEVRNRTSAKSIFDSGARVLDPKPVPVEVLTALRSASRDENPQIALEALYAFGALSANSYGPDREALLATSAAELTALLGSSRIAIREAAVEVVARMYERWPGDGAVEQSLGDALVATFNDRDGIVRRKAMITAGALRYERGIQALTEIFQHYERGVDAQAALDALARIAHPSSVPLFTSVLGGRDTLLKAAAVEGLARSGDATNAARVTEAVGKERNADLQLAAHFADAMLAEGSIDVLVDGLTKPALHDRALHMLSEVAPGRSATFSPHVPDPKPNIRADLLEALGLSNDPDLAPLVERLLNDTDPMVARMAARAVLRLKSPGATAPRP